MNIGIKWVSKANMWQVYQKEDKKKMNNKDSTLNKEYWFATEQEAKQKLKELTK